MASFDGAYASLIQGVSQQVPTSRLDGQVTEQINMVSDLVTGLRRRTGSSLRFAMQSEGATNSLRAWKTDVGGISSEFYLNTNTGELIMLEEGSVNELKRFQADYLITNDPSTIRHAGVGDSLFIANTKHIPEGTKTNTGSTYKTGGFYQVVGSALMQKFTVQVSDGVRTYNGVFTTPSGSKPKHTKWVTSEFIAERLLASLKGETWTLPETPPGSTEDPDPIITQDPNNTFNQYFDSWIQGNTVYIKSKTNLGIKVTTDSARIYMVASKAGRVESVGDLPARLPDQADGFILEVGRTGSDPTYFKYDDAQARWVETSHPDSYTSIKNMPVELYWDGYDWILDTDPYLGRLSGDSETNPDPDFLDWGITGIGSYQSRLVILSGSWVWLSATNTPRQFYRKTVEELLDTDPIGIGSSSASSASFQYSIIFNKDLILFSPEHQALIQGGNVALTPKTAHILVTSTYTADMSASPVTLGSSIMYPMPRSAKYFGVMEMIPSPYADSMYASVDASEHIPTYMQGRCRFAVSSSVGAMVLFGTTSNLNELYVHEYMWSGEEKVLKSWHKWEFDTNIATAFFSGGLINLVTVDESTGTIMVSNIDPKEGDGSGVNTNTYFLDFHTVLDVVREDDLVYAKIPEYYSNYMKGTGLHTKLRVAYYGGNLNTTEVGSEICPECVRVYLNPSTTADKVVLGLMYESLVTPTQPVIRDYQERPIVFSKMQLIKMYIMTDQSGEFLVEVRDTARRGDIDYEVSPIKWYSTDLNLGKLPVGGTTGSVIPCRVDSATAQVTFRTLGLDEFNILNLEYTCKSSLMRSRR